MMEEQPDQESTETLREVTPVASCQVQRKSAKVDSHNLLERDDPRIRGRTPTERDVKRL